MRNILTTVIKRNIRAKASTMRNRVILQKIVDHDQLKHDYNPKTARHKSLKGLNFPGSR